MVRSVVFAPNEWRTLAFNPIKDNCKRINEWSAKTYR